VVEPEAITGEKVINLTIKQKLSMLGKMIFVSLLYEKFYFE
jgi:hypothetical protein